MRSRPPMEWVRLGPREGPDADQQYGPSSRARIRLVLLYGSCGRPRRAGARNARSMLLPQMVSDYPNKRRRGIAGGPRRRVAREARATDPTGRPGRDDGCRFQVQERETIT